MFSMIPISASILILFNIILAFVVATACVAYGTKNRCLMQAGSYALQRLLFVMISSLIATWIILLIL